MIVDIKLLTLKIPAKEDMTRLEISEQGECSCQLFVLRAFHSHKVLYFGTSEAVAGGVVNGVMSPSELTWGERTSQDHTGPSTVGPGAIHGFKSHG